MSSRSDESNPRPWSSPGRLRRRIASMRTSLETLPESPEADPPRRPRAGHPPQAELEPTNLGPVMDEAVLRAKLRMRIGADPDYDLLHEHFDVLHYLLQEPDLIDDPDVDLIEHFLEHGRELGLSPDPDFSMTGYLDRYPGKTAQARVGNPYLHWLRHGRAEGHVADPAPLIRRVSPVLGMTPEEITDHIVARRHDVLERFRTGRLGEMLARAAEIEPLIGTTWREITDVHLVPLSRAGAVDEFTAIYRAQEAAGFRRARVVLVINRVRWGGGRRMEGHIAHALAQHIDPADIVVVYTDKSDADRVPRFPAGVREVDFAGIAETLPEQLAMHALTMFLRTFRADSIVNINSRLLHSAMRIYGRALAATERIFPCYFCNEQTGMGTWVGYSLTYFYRSIDEVTGVLTDSQYLADELADTYRVLDDDRARLHVFRAPVPTDLPVVTGSPAREGRRPQVFWAGRWDRQKRIGLFFDIARAMPDVDFRMWGEAVLTGGQVTEIPANVTVEGRYGHIAEVPLADADAWLYTSGWDGVPSQLLEVAVTGIPIVASSVGGTGEVIGDDDAWPVPEDEGAPSYVDAIRAVLADPADARRRAAALRERVMRERTLEAFAETAAALLLRDGAGEEGR